MTKIISRGNAPASILIYEIEHSGMARRETRERTTRLACLLTDSRLKKVQGSGAVRATTPTGKLP
ncbi:MAG TPA: hypothetical protein VKV19_06970 [Ktedonobacteraceae bacterium]|nr:hypothetical protein [Ktedonobacteraceae bacterium]